MLLSSQSLTVSLIGPKEHAISHSFIGAFIFGLASIANPSGAQAGACEDAWFTRNSIMNDAGYCFGSTLGQAHFDNTDCTGKSVELSVQDQESVARLQGTEEYQECAIDTSQSVLDLDDLAIRTELEVQPVLYQDGEGFYCIGYYGETDLLRVAPRADSEITGALRTGDWFVTAHNEIGLWSYVSVRHHNDAAVVAGGWTRLPKDFFESCERAAG